MRARPHRPALVCFANRTGHSRQRLPTVALPKRLRNVLLYGMLPAVLAGGVQPYVAERLICTTSDSMLWHYSVEAALVHVPKQVWPCQRVRRG